MDKPIILISVGKQNHSAAWNEIQRTGAGCSLDYVNSILRAGGVPLLLPRMADTEAIRIAAELAHGIVFTGGGDVVSLNYGEEPHPASKGVDPTRDEMELALARIAEELHLPILGICRGMQLLNVASGGTLVQDIPTQVAGAHQHFTDSLEPTAAHTVDVDADSRLHQILGGRQIYVNSYHHQSVKDVGAGLRVTARSRDGVAEAMEATDGRTLIAVQWHPEEMSATDSPSRSLFQWIVDEARRFRDRAALAGPAEGPVTHLSTEAPAEIGDAGSPTPINRITEAILREALRLNATEIHLEPISAGLVVSFAIDGALRTVMTLPKHVQAELFAHLRMKAGLDGQDRTSAQEGVIPVQIGETLHRFNLSYQPSPVGESILIRIDNPEE